tara:strand:- start:120 stop:539 length:420 start_codon:yes stop_codon:yes gene_type:complete
MSFGYTILGFGVSSGVAALGAALNFDAGGEGIGLSYAGASSTTSGIGDLDGTVTPSGGSGSYTYSWSLAEIDDPDDKWSVFTVGSPQNAAQYDTARFTCSSNLAGGDPPPQSAVYRVSCEVGDGATTVTVSQNISLELS